MGIWGFGKQHRLLAWQKTVLSNSPEKLVCSEDQLKKMTEGLVANDVRIINESIQIISVTKNAETLKSRQKLLAERIQHLEKLDSFINHKYKSLLASAKKWL